jgi:hypothetical protein
MTVFASYRDSRTILRVCTEERDQRLVERERWREKLIQNFIGFSHMLRRSTAPK